MAWISRKFALLIGRLSSETSVLNNKPRKNTLAVSMGQLQIAIINEAGHRCKPETSPAGTGAV